MDSDRGLPAVRKSETVAVRGVVDRLDTEGRMVLAAWTEAMIRIHDSPLSKLEKMTRALKATFASRATWPIMKALAGALHETLRSARQSRQGRIGLVVAGALAIFGGQAAGIAALGTAVAVPLWVVVGGGYAFLEALQAMLVPTSGDFDRE